MTDMEKITTFLTTNIWGLIILGGVGSAFGSIIVYIMRRLYFWFAKRYMVFRTKTFFRKVIEQYSEGYMAGYASESQIHQITLVGRYIMEIITNSTILVVILLTSLGLLVTLPFGVIWIVVFLTGLFIVFPIRKINRTLYLYRESYDQLFNPEDIKKKANEYLKKTIHDFKDKTNKNNEKE